MSFSRPLTLEEALTEVGTGRFQWMLMAVLGLANAADAVEILSVGLLGTAAEKDLHLTPERVGALNACIFAGMFLGGILWGMLGDAFGRRISLLVALLVNACFGLLSAFCRNLGQMMFLRLVAGLGVGGSMPIVFAQMSEFCPPATRGKLLAVVASFWMFGSIFSALSGWLIIPHAGWRIFVVVASLPAWTSALLLWALVPESPRHLAVVGRPKEAAQVLLKMADMNRRTLPEDFCLAPVQHRDSWEDDEQGEAGGPAPSGHGSGGSASRHLQSSQQNPLAKALRSAATAAALGARRALLVVRTLFSRPLSAHTWPLSVAWMGLCGGWYATVLWVPRYFEARGADASSVYRQTLAVALANLPGNIASVYLVDALGRRLTACLCMAGACISALLFAAAPAYGSWPTVAACVFNGISVGGWNSLDMISSELFPTTLRSSGFGVLQAIGRVASFATTYAAGALIEVQLWAPLVMAAVLLGAGSGAMMLLPEPAGQPLEDSSGPRAHGGQDPAKVHMLASDSAPSSGAASRRPSHDTSLAAGLLAGGGPAGVLLAQSRVPSSLRSSASASAKGHDPMHAETVSLLSAQGGP